MGYNNCYMKSSSNNYNIWFGAHVCTIAAIGSLSDEPAQTLISGLGSFSN